MAEINTSTLCAQIERVYSQFQGSTPEQFRKAVEDRAERLSVFERACLGALYVAANVRDGDQAQGLYDTWSATLCPTDAQTDREYELWSWADAAVESALVTAH